MLSDRITVTFTDTPPFLGKRVMAVFAYRYDAELVPDLIANITPVVQGYAMLDDRPGSGLVSDEPARRRALLEAARDAGADWVLAIDPDERIEQGVAEMMPALVGGEQRVIWSFRLREMFSETQFRVDGIWGGRRVARLFPISAARLSDDAAFHGQWFDQSLGYPLRMADANVYHLRMIAPARRRLRWATYALHDPERRSQAIGYDYLLDDRHMVLMNVSRKRQFRPAFRETGALWGPPIEDMDRLPRDPVIARLSLVRRYAERHKYRHAATTAMDLSNDFPDCLSLAALAAHWSAVSGVPWTGADGPQPPWYARFLQTLPGADTASNPLQDALRDPFTDPDPMSEHARWRFWARGGAQITEGQHVIGAGIAVIVIGFRDEPFLRDAVQSVLDQSEPSEVVVVHSGGGPVRQALADLSDRVRLITLTEPHNVSEARNIGIDASRAPIVAFLAGDCVAQPGWIKRRLSAHAKGHSAVSSPVVPFEPENPVGEVSHYRMFMRRRPDTPRDQVFHYGVSYDRRLFDIFGYFDVAHARGEDTEFNRRIGTFEKFYFAKKVLTAHREPAHLAGLVSDAARRGWRIAAHAPFDTMRASAGTLVQLVKRARNLRGVLRRLHPGAVTGARGRRIGFLLRLRAAQYAEIAGIFAALLVRPRRGKPKAADANGQDDVRRASVMLAPLDGSPWHDAARDASKDSRPTDAVLLSLGAFVRFPNDPEILEDLVSAMQCLEDSAEAGRLQQLVGAVRTE